MKCRTCRQDELVISVENRLWDEGGLPGVTLVDVEVRRCGNCGAEVIAIPRIEELHRVLAFTVAEQEARLGGAEIRFLRKYLGWSGADFAETLGVTRETVSRWENESTDMGPVAERLLRLCVLRVRPVDEYPTQELARVARADMKRGRLVLRNDHGWKAVVAPAA